MAKKAAKAKGAKKTLASCRKEINRIDEAIHNLIMERTLVVADIAEIKKNNKGSFALHPDREAEILRKLIARHKGDFPKPALIRIWREMFGAFVQLQGDFPISVYMPKRGTGYLEVARDHCGSYAQTIPVTTVGQVVHAVSQGDAAIGIVPIIEEDDKDPWWPKIISELQPKPKVIGKLPFVGPGGGRGDGLEAFVIALLDQKKTKEDRSLFIIELEGDVSRAKLKDIFEKAGLPFGAVLDTRKITPDIVLHVIEMTDFVADDDNALNDIVESEEINISRLIKLGGYAVPFVSNDLWENGEK